MRSFPRHAAAASAALLAVAALGGCASDDDDADPNPGVSSPAAAPSAAAAAPLVGEGCADYAKAVPTGPGSIEGMATQPVTAAAESNPMLTTLAEAVAGGINPEVNLVETLNGGRFTVFAPIDTAFAKVPAVTLETLRTDSALLTKVLNYHLVQGKIAPDKIVGEQTTVQGGTVAVNGSGDALTVNDATVVCGGVETANATVYLIDAVLMPAS